MGIEFNGKGNVNNNLFINGGIKPQQTNGKEKVEVNITDNKAVGEFGNKLLDQVQPRFIQAAKIPETDRAELNEMFAMAGIKNAKMPTVPQYKSIANQVDTATTALEELRTTTHTEDLFNSPEFGTLNDLFGIS